MNIGTYAILGNTCQTSLNVLTSNTKFIPMDDPIYNMIYTKMNLYPGRTNEEEKEDKNEKKDDAKESYKAPGCCGRK